MSDSANAGERLARRIESTFRLTAEERQAVRAVPVAARVYEAHQDIVREGDRPVHCCLVLSGLACRYKSLDEGARQILSLHVAGDVPDLQSLHLGVMDHSLAAVSPITAGLITHEHVHGLIERHPRLGAALWRLTLIDSSIFRQWIIGLGQKDALRRMAHLFCELFTRMQAVGLTDARACPLPITQGDLGDALGLSAVHTNRVLQELRARGLITLDRRRLTILDWDGLRTAAEFDPLYLHQDRGEAS